MFDRKRDVDIDIALDGKVHCCTGERVLRTHMPPFPPRPLLRLLTTETLICASVCRSIPEWRTPLKNTRCMQDIRAGDC